jgi:hypothetical protein
MEEIALDEARERLTRHVPIENYFIVGGKGETDGSIVYWDPEIGMRWLIIEQGDIARACKRLLHIVGARRFTSTEELTQAPRLEKWPGWDTCADAVRLKASIEMLRKKK